MLELCSIASGSSGNCICVGTDDCHVLIDAGISGKKIENGLNEFDMTEKHFQYTFYLILRLIGVYCRAIHCENRQSFGRVDCILEMDEYVYIFEFKMDGTAEEALQQIAEKGYARSYLTDNRKIVCIGVNFSSLTRTVEEWKEIIYR